MPDARTAASRSAGAAAWAAPLVEFRFRAACAALVEFRFPCAALAVPLVDSIRPSAAANRFGLEPAPVEHALRELGRAGRVVEGEFLPDRRGREWCDSDVLRLLRRRSLAKLRREVEPVEPEALARFLVDWHGLRRPEPGSDALLAALERLEGAPLSVSALLADLLPARIRDFSPADLDLLCARGEVVWRGIERIGPSDGRVALYCTDRYRLLAPPAGLVTGALAAQVRESLRARGALFWHDLRAAISAFPAELLDALWETGVGR